MNNPGETITRWTIAAFVVAVLAGVVYLSSLLFSGAGSLQSVVTVRGVYAVENPSDLPAVCFINAKSGAISCVPRKAL